MVSASGLERDQLTLTAFAVLGLQGFLLNGIGSVLVPMQDQLLVSQSAVAIYPTLVAAAVVAVGLFGGRAVARLGHRRGLALSLVLMTAGVCLLGSPVRWLTLAGAVTLGTGTGLSIALIPAILAQRHPTMAPVAFGEANAAASIAALAAPAAVALALALGWGWQFGYVLPAVPVAGLLLYIVAAKRLPFAAPSSDLPTRPPLTGPGLFPGRLAPRLAVLFAAVSVEFCLVFWAAQALKEWHGAEPAIGAALSAAFLVGMAAVRAGSAWLTAGRHPLRIVLTACFVTIAGFVIFWTVPSLPGSAVGLVVAGGGVALMYPALLARAVSARPATPDRTTRLCALMSGLAIGGAPFVLAQLADAVGLRAAYLAVPAILAGMGVYCIVALRDRAPAAVGG